MGDRGRSTRGFTLIEIMAVATIFALLAAFVAPQIGGLGGRALRGHAEDIGAQVQLARERAILTGTPHRVLFDLTDHGYRLEWWTTEARARGEEEVDFEPFEEPLDLRASLSLEPPLRDEETWHPVPGRLGRFLWLDEDLRLAGIESGGSWIEAGDADVAFEWDGATLPAVIHLEDEQERRLLVRVLPLADAVRIEHDR